MSEKSKKVSNSIVSKVKKIENQIAELNEANNILENKVEKLEKKKSINKKKIIIGTTIGLLTTGIIATSIALPISISNKISHQVSLILFTNQDFASLRGKIIEKVQTDKLSEPAFVKYAMFDLFKNNLLASNKNIGNLIISVEVTQYISDSITFKVILSPDKDKYEYRYYETNTNIEITNNILLITYAGNDSIAFIS